MAEQIIKRTKFEAAVGAGITAIITNFLVRDALMPEWAFGVLILLILAYFGNWGMVIVEYTVKRWIDVKVEEIQIRYRYDHTKPEEPGRVDN